MSRLLECSVGTPVCPFVFQILVIKVFCGNSCGWSSMLTCCDGQGNNSKQNITRTKEIKLTTKSKSTTLTEAGLELP